VPYGPSSKGRVAGGRQGDRVLIIGCGFIGSHVVTELACQNRPPIVLTRSQPPDEVLPAIADGDLHIGDASRASDLTPALDEVRHVVYCAGGLLPARSQEDPELDAKLTLRPLRAVLDALRERPGVRFTYISSGGTVYGEPDELPVNESAPVRPHGSYGELHLVCEEEIERDRREHGLHARILRCSTVYGERQWPDRGQGVIATFLHRIEQDRQIDLYGGAKTIRDYIYVGDVAKAVIALLDRDGGEAVLNLGSGEGTSLTELLALVEEEVGRRARIRNHPERDFDVSEIVLDTTRLRRLIEFEPTALEVGIARTHAWLTAQTPEPV
jgi:UDP-glucose 4-epimerase